MLFNSPEFLLLFLPVALGLFYLSAKFVGGRAAHLVLIACSAFFYAWWDWKYLGLLFGSTCFNYIYGSFVSKSKNKLFLIFGIIANISVLGYFKYTDFAIQNINLLTGMRIDLLNIVLPLGISFFTFQKIGYLVDCYNGVVNDRDPIRFGLFVMFFPQLIAGPIVHHGQIIPQLREHENNPLPSSTQIAQGIFYLVIGLFKKLIIADNIANVVVPGFSNVGSLELIEAWTIAVGYSLQLYFDFSAYSEMALGIALHFWRRWHMTLGAFMRQYIYIPLGGSKKGLTVMMLASMGTMLVGGLWHGAGWTFVAWGCLHGLMLVIHKAWTLIGIFKLKEWVAKCLTLVCVIFAWIPFRANSIEDTVVIWKKMIGYGGMSLPMEYQSIPLLNNVNVNYHISTIFNGFELLVLLMVLYLATNFRNTHELWNSFKPNKINAAYIISASLICLFSLSRPSSFLYFSF
jgi:D-alanyl-lipoteichoic acid acyltransferase DltB (MBOAT superfamily)